MIWKDTNRAHGNYRISCDGRLRMVIELTDPPTVGKVPAQVTAS
jgi:hypothetical protein